MVEPGTGRTLAGMSKEEAVDAPRREKKSPFGRALAGALVGIALGVILVVWLYPQQETVGDPAARTWYFVLLLIGAVAGGVAGIAAGALFGRIFGRRAR
jgi:hypothetical protein